MRNPFNRGLSSALQRTVWVGLLVGGAFGHGLIAQESLDQIVTAHIDARGGASAWNAVDTMQITGSHTAFSEAQPFVVYRKRQGVWAKYSIRGALGPNRRNAGWDGEVAWWQDESTGGIDWPTEIGGSAKVALLQETEMATPLFDWRQKEYDLELLAPSDIDGVAAIQLRLTRPSGEVELWFLDPSTYLEIARDATADEFGRPMSARTYFDDFRTVAGPKGSLTVPHYIEAEWGIRHRVTEISSIELNGELGDDLFAMPLPPGMEPLLDMVGRWQVDTESREVPEEPFQRSERRAEIREDFEHTLVRERIDEGPTRGEMLWGFDRHKAIYRMVQVDGRRGRPNILQGVMEDGRLTVSNIKTDTTFSLFGLTVHERYSLFDFTEQGFRLQREISTDGGASWGVVEKSVYSKIEPVAP